jgi:hypothetical protein
MKAIKTNYELQNVQPLKTSDAMHNHCEKSKHKNHCSILLLQNKLQLNKQKQKVIVAWLM